MNSSIITLVVDLVIDKKSLNNLISILDNNCKNICSHNVSSMNFKVYLCQNEFFELYYNDKNYLVNIMCRSEDECVKVLNEYLFKVVPKNKVLIHMIQRGIPG
ncbi:hypothetical protein [Staphylothermus hellenicus]|uniref:Uncharacterized protein n=1 Tax=Staphylothermus hellenicus (strain DSM 12710 / JCM 10830 / BK20S6-10-b1 / P8) TaxID=591019 RepID=D7DAL4_STAHD|nr:hypothetical protein [Staphylothermus hellenicus]ADI31211.1 hypothetical protein Shell_0062 [Staphylothermus hellenicus DSM 12710]